MGVSRVSIMSRLGVSPYCLHPVHCVLLEVSAAYLLSADALKPNLPQLFRVGIVAFVMAADLFHFGSRKTALRYGVRISQPPNIGCRTVAA